MQFRIYNTLTRKIEEFKPLKPNHVGIYMCGMTVQDRPHLGHIRTFLVGDTLRRYLEYLGFEVTYVQNFTDIDDKIIKKAQEENIDWRSLGQKYVDKYLKSAEKLNIKPATHYPRATQFIQEIIDIVETLIQKGFAYEAGGSVYFDVTKFPEYGKLSGKKIEELLEGARIEPDPNKRHPFDFALWKAYKEGEPYWYSPWGKGRPGWHIECSAMSTHFLGQPFDIHAGGQDLIFPHHEDEIAQSEAARGVRFVNYWVHTGSMQIRGEKMSKSTGLFFAIDDILGEYSPQAVRLFILQKHYRSPMDYIPEYLKEAEKAWKRILSFLKESKSTGDNVINKEYINAFEEAMNNDLNTPKAVSIIFELLKKGNTRLQQGEVPAEERGTLLLLLKILGFELKEIEKVEGDLQEKILEILIEIRQKLRIEKNFVLADEIRDRLKDIGIILKDTKEGTKWDFS